MSKKSKRAQGAYWSNQIEGSRHNWDENASNGKKPEWWCGTTILPLEIHHCTERKLIVVPWWLMRIIFGAPSGNQARQWKIHQWVRWFSMIFLLKTHWTHIFPAILWLFPLEAYGFFDSSCPIRQGFFGDDHSGRLWWCFAASIWATELSYNML